MRAASTPRVAAQVFVDDPSTPQLTDADRHHLTRVLRLAEGEVVVAADGRGTAVRCRFIGAGPLLEPCAGPLTTARPTPAVTVAFAPMKGDRPEWVVQKLTELGVDRIVPLVTERAVVRWEPARAARALERWRRIAREAAAQSRRWWLPEIGAPLHLAELAEREGEHLAVAERNGGPPSLGHPVVAVGPEGGWSDAELSMGLPTVRLGDAVLRAETAAVAAATLLGALRDGTVSARRAP